MSSQEKSPAKTGYRPRTLIFVAIIAIIVAGVVLSLSFMPQVNTQRAPDSPVSPSAETELHNSQQGDQSSGNDLLDPHTIPKFINSITGPLPVFVPSSGNNYTITMTRFSEQILPPPLPPTKVMGFGGLGKDAVTGQSLGFVRSAPGPTFDINRGTPVRVTWRNELTGPYDLPVDPTLHWADPAGMGMPMTASHPPFPPGYPDAQALIPTTIHLHGSETMSSYDGTPEAWFTADGRHGPDYATVTGTDPNAAVYEYTNLQPATTLWYHDHALGLTRINVLSGLSGIYLIRDPETTRDAIAPLLPSGEYEIPLIIQDRQFWSNGSLYFPADGNNPDVHPYWAPEFFGDTILVNGKVWPDMKVKQGQYRFRILDSSNARFYAMSLSNGMPFTQIGSDGGYLKAPATLTNLTIGPAERADILVDFSGLAPGTKVILRNTANAPFPGGDPVDPETTGTIMQFTVTGEKGLAAAKLPGSLNPTLAGDYPNLPAPDRRRILVLYEVESDTEEPLMSMLNGQKWEGVISELPKNGSTEDWAIVDITDDSHPIHLHLIQFQLVRRQDFDKDAYTKDWIALNGNPPFDPSVIPKELPVEPYLKGSPILPSPAEQGWKDTIQAGEGQVTVIRARFTPVDGRKVFAFDPTEGPGYVWHCHILDHEDNEMMRPYKVVP